jgi:DNA-binding response OmpR family regulator
LKRVLLVDDDAQFRRTLRLALNSQGFEICEAAGGMEALNVLTANAPDLVVLDWHMPEMDGIETCRAIREKVDVSVIMVSADRSNSKVIALEAGAADYLAKPFSLAELLARIESVMHG